MSLTHTVRAGAAAALAAALLLTGCLAEESTPPATQGGGGADTWVTIQAGLQSTCGCHQATPGPSGLSLLPGAYASIVNVDSAKNHTLSYVKRYNRNTSTLYLTAFGTAGMPSGMTSPLADRIGVWIDAGAPQ